MRVAVELVADLEVRVDAAEVEEVCARALAADVDDLHAVVDADRRHVAGHEPALAQPLNEARLADERVARRHNIDAVGRRRGGHRVGPATREQATPGDQSQATPRVVDRGRDALLDGNT